MRRATLSCKICFEIIAHCSCICRVSNVAEATASFRSDHFAFALRITLKQPKHRASKALRQGNYRKDESKGIGAGCYRWERVRPVRARRLAVDAGDPIKDGREGYTYKSLNRCFLRIRNSKKEKLFLTPSSHPLIARGGLAAKLRVENA